MQQVGCRWQDAPAVYGTHKTLYSRWNRWSKNGWFGETMEKLAIRGKKAHIIMIDSTCFKVHRTVAGLKCYVGELGRLIGKTRGGWNTKLHALCDAKGRILSLYLTGANVSDHKGAEVLLEKLPNRVEHFLGDMGYDSNEIRNILESMGIEPCIPGKKNRVVAIEYDAEFYKERNKIERAFGRIKDWRRVATRYDRCPEMFLSACALVAIVKFWL